MSNEKKVPLVQVVKRTPTAIPAAPVKPKPVAPQPSSFRRPTQAVLVPNVSPVARVTRLTGETDSKPKLSGRFGGVVSSEQAVAALAQKERVPHRIAKGELDGKMKCRIWKKKQPIEAKRFDEAYSLMAATPGLALEDAFALSQSGMSPEELAVRRLRSKRRDSIRAARGATKSEVIDAILSKFLDSKTEVCVTLSERSFIDTIIGVLPVSIEFERSGLVEKLQMVCLCARTSWDALLPSLEREQRLAQKPMPVSRLPEKRPYSDPNVFGPSVGHTVRLTLRNGLLLKGPLEAVGAFDLLLTIQKLPIIVPIHALINWISEAS
jgi:hypothetical protein